MNRAEIERRFKRHIPDDGQNAWMDLGRMHVTNLAQWIDEFCPDNKEKDQALNRLDECLFWMNGSILRHNQSTKRET